MSEPDLTAFSPAKLIANAVTALTPGLVPLNQQEERGYATAVANWKLNTAAGHPGPIPDPPMAYELKVDEAEFTVAIVRSQTPVCAKFVDPGTPVVALVAAVGPPIAEFPGRFYRGYINGVPDNTPAGYELAPFGPQGPRFRKVIEGEIGHFNYVGYYVLVMS